MIDGTTTRLRPPKDADLPLLQQLRNDPALQAALMARARPNSPARVQEWLNRRLGDPDGLFFVIAAIRNDQAIGFIQVTGMEALNGTGWLGIALAPQAQGHGHATEALHLLADYGRTTFGLRKILLHVLAANERAVGLYRKVGFDDVGVLRAHHYHGGQHHDVRILEWFIGGEDGRR